MGAAMNYTIKAIPTTYAGVRFRSRLEARWAAFFDLCGWSWDYEPIDLDGWAPDFILKFPIADIYVEVKPVETDSTHGFPALPMPWREGSNDPFDKTRPYINTLFVLALGARPQADWIGVGRLSDGGHGYGGSWHDVHDNLRINGSTKRWAEAGNLVQWRKG